MTFAVAHRERYIGIRDLGPTKRYMQPLEHEQRVLKKNKNRLLSVLRLKKSRNCDESLDIYINIITILSFSLELKIVETN